MTPILSETFAPPKMTLKGFLGLFEQIGQNLDLLR